MHTFRATVGLAMAMLLAPAAFGQAQSDGKPPMQIVGGKIDAPTAPAIPVEDQATPEQVDRLFQVMRVRQQVESTLKQMSGVMQQQVSLLMKKDVDGSEDAKKTTPEQTAARQKIMSQFTERALHAYTVDEMLVTLTPIYQRHISRSDIEATIAFYGSSAGQHMLEQQPLITQEYLSEMSKTMQEKITKVTDELKKDLDEQTAKENTDKSAQ